MISVKIVANITYSGFTYNTPLILEYEHTGKQWFYKKGKNEIFTESAEIAQEKISSGIKVVEKPGYYYIKRMAIPTTNAKGENDIWYIDNEGDTYTINKVSKYAKRYMSN
jgi:hypothetical protein